jgi:hypothetical protein
MFGWAAQQEGTQYFDLVSAAVLNDGQLGAWSSQWLTSFQSTSVTVNEGLFVIAGGFNSDTGSPTRTVQSGTVDTSGQLHSLGSLSENLPELRVGGNAFIRGGFVFVVGGASANGVTTVPPFERATIDSTGLVQGWRELPDQGLTNELQGARAVAAGNRLVVYGTSSHELRVSTFQPGGSIGSFGPAAALPADVEEPSVATDGARVYLAIGRPAQGATPASDSFRVARIGSDGTIGAFVEGPSLPGPRDRAALTVAHDHLYLLGGATDWLGNKIESSVYVAALCSAPCPAPMECQAAATCSDDIGLCEYAALADGSGCRGGHCKAGACVPDPSGPEPGCSVGCGRHRSAVFLPALVLLATARRRRA